MGENSVKNKSITDIKKTPSDMLSCYIFLRKCSFAYTLNYKIWGQYKYADANRDLGWKMIIIKKLKILFYSKYQHHSTWWILFFSPTLSLKCLSEGWDNEERLLCFSRVLSFFVSDLCEIFPEEAASVIYSIHS